MSVAKLFQRILTIGVALLGLSACKPELEELLKSAAIPPDLLEKLLAKRPPIPTPTPFAKLSTPRPEPSATSGRGIDSLDFGKLAPTPTATQTQPTPGFLSPTPRSSPSSTVPPSPFPTASPSGHSATPSVSPSPLPEASPSPTPSSLGSATPAATPGTSKPDADSSACPGYPGGNNADGKPKPRAKEDNSHSGFNGIPSLLFTSTGGGLCTGTFVTEHIMVSAAHCFYQIGPGEKGNYEFRTLNFKGGFASPKGVGGDVHISPKHNKKADGIHHDFAIVRFDEKDLNLSMERKPLIAPLCENPKMAPGTQVKLSGHRTGNYFEACVEREFKDAHGGTKNYQLPWKVIGDGELNTGVQLKTRDSGLLPGDSGGGLFVGNQLCGVLSRLSGAGGEIAGQYAIYATVNDCVRNTIRELSGGPRRATWEEAHARGRERHFPPSDSSQLSRRRIDAGAGH